MRPKEKTHDCSYYQSGGKVVSESDTVGREVRKNEWQYW